MEDVGIFYGHLACFKAIWFIFVAIWYFLWLFGIHTYVSQFWFCAKKNLAALTARVPQLSTLSSSCFQIVEESNNVVDLQTSERLLDPDTRPKQIDDLLKKYSIISIEVSATCRLKC
jgi:capsule polysaccharide export protein KpsE/RkpR